MQIGVLGPLRVLRDGQELDLGPLKQRRLLAGLALTAGRVVSVDALVDLLWGHRPPAAVAASVHGYVAALRRVLEPGRPPRGDATVLVTQAPGYLLRVPVGAVDAAQFAATLAAAQHGLSRSTASASGVSDFALRGSAPSRSTAELEQIARTLAAALSWWRGTPYAELGAGPHVVAERSRLEELRVRAVLLQARLELALGRPASETTGLAQVARLYPLREDVWVLWAEALARAGRQADALAALRAVREALREELGVDAGTAVRDLELAVLRQALPVVDIPAAALLLAPAGPAIAPTEGRPGGVGMPDGLVGRDSEIAQLHAAAGAAQRAHQVRLAWVTGEPGAGKSGLLAHVGDQLTAQGWLVLTGRCPELSGGLPGRAWVEVVRSLVGPEPAAAGNVDPLLTGGTAGAASQLYGRRLLGQALVERLTAAGRERPVAVLLDDLQDADTLSLALLGAVVQETNGTPLLVVGAYRPDPPTLLLEEVLRELAGAAPMRLNLTGLGAQHARQLVRAVSGIDPPASALAALIERTGGNAFFLSESAYLMRRTGLVAALAQVPDGARAVLRQRISRLGAATRDVLQLAAVLGRDVDLEVLTAVAVDAAIAEEAVVAEAIEAAEQAGLLSETTPGLLRFRHGLVRDTLYGDIPAPRRAHWHARVAAVLQRNDTVDVAALATHCYRSGTSAGARAALAAARAAAVDAMARYAPDTAVERYDQALAALARLSSREDAVERIDLQIGMSRAQLAAGAGVAARATRLAAARGAARAGDDVRLVRALAAWDQPTMWTLHPYGSLDREVVTLYERALDLSDLSGEHRCRLLCGLVHELAGQDGKYAAEAAQEAVTLARCDGEPSLLGLALHARGVVMLHEGDVQGRLPLAEELLQIGRGPRQAVFTLLGHEYLIQWAAAYGRTDMVAEHVEQLAGVVQTYRWGQARGAVAMHRGLLGHLRGDLDNARRHYSDGIAVLRRNGGLDVDQIAALAAITVALTADQLAPLEETVRSFVPVPAAGLDFYAIVLTAAGHLDEAIAARRNIRPIPRDFFRSLMLSIRGCTLVKLSSPTGLDATDQAAEVYAELSAFRGQVGGATTGTFAVGPVDTLLGDLARLLNRPEAASTHYAAAAQLALQCGSAQWAEDARFKAAELSGSSRST